MTRRSYGAIKTELLLNQRTILKPTLPTDYSAKFHTTNYLEIHISITWSQVLLTLNISNLILKTLPLLSSLRHLLSEIGNPQDQLTKLKQPTAPSLPAETSQHAFPRVNRDETTSHKKSSQISNKNRPLKSHTTSLCLKYNNKTSSKALQISNTNTSSNKAT